MKKSLIFVRDHYKKKKTISMKNLSLIIFLGLISSSTLIAQTSVTSGKNVVATNDIENLIGEWAGTLTYIDYNTSNPYTMPCQLEVKSKKKNQKLLLYYNYPNEPKANGKSKIKISKDRSKVNQKSIISRTKMLDGNTQIITEYSGKDGNDNKRATIRNVYIIGTKNFIIRKEVQFEGTTEWLKRNEYNFNKN